MTDEETSIRISKDNRNWLQDLKRRWKKSSLDSVVSHIKYYFDNDTYQYYAENDKESET